MDIERIDIVADRDEIVDVLGAAFAQHPMVPRKDSERKARVMIATMLDVFDGAPDTAVWGIRRDGKLVCATFVFQDGYEPGLWATLKLLWLTIWLMGIRQIGAFFRMMAARDKGKDKRLEIMLLGTREAYQAQGLGRAMIRHVFEQAKANGYDAVALEVAKDTPAYSFYEHEGFVLRREIPMKTMTLCMMKRPL